MQAFLKKAIGHTLQHWLSWSLLNIIIYTNCSSTQTQCGHRVFASRVAHGNRPSMLYPQSESVCTCPIWVRWACIICKSAQEMISRILCVHHPIHPVCLCVHSNPNTLNDCGQSSNYIRTYVCTYVPKSASQFNFKLQVGQQHTIYVGHCISPLLSHCWIHTSFQGTKLRLWK